MLRKKYLGFDEDLFECVGIGMHSILSQKVIDGF